MDRRLVSTLLLCLGLLGVIAVGGVAGEIQTAPGDAQNSDHAAESVDIDDALHGADGEIQVMVSLVEDEGATGPAALQAHASATQESLVTFAESTPGVTVENRFWLTNAALVTVDTEQVSILELASVEGVEAVFENAELEITASAERPSAQSGEELEPDSAHTYGLEQINAPTAWEQHGTQGDGASVAVLDTGVDTDHPDLNVTEWAQFDEEGNPVDSEPNDGHGHGTHVSGTAVGSDDPAGDVPVYSVAPGADLYGVKALNDNGTGTFAQVIAGMEWAVNESVDVISMSLGAEGYLEEFLDPVQNAHDAGTVVVASVGNGGEGSSASPGNVYESIGVGSSDAGGEIAPFSSGEVVETDTDWGSDALAGWPEEYTVPTVTAPGVDVLSAWSPEGYQYVTGTSMSAPHVAGAVALAVSAADKELQPGEIAEALEETAFKPGGGDTPPGERDTRYGSGIVNANAAAASLADLDGPFLTLSVDAPGTVGEGAGSMTIDYTLENFGGAQGTESAVNLLVGGDQVDTDENVTVAAGETANGTLTFEDLDGYEEGDLIEWTVELTEFEASTSGVTGVGLLPGTEIVIRSIDAPLGISPDQNLTVEYTLENLGAEDGMESFVDLLVDGTGETYDDTDSDVVVPAGETVNGTLTLADVDQYFEVGDIIDFTVELWEFGDIETGETAVEAADAEDEFEVTVVATNTPVDEGGTLDVTAEIANVGNGSASQLVTLDVPGLGADETEVGLVGGESTQETLSVETGAGDAGEYTATVTSQDDEANATVTVEQPEQAVLLLQDVGTNAPVVEGENLTVTATVQNVGNETTIASVVAYNGDLGEASANVTVDAEATENVTLVLDTAVGETGEYTLNIETTDDAMEVPVVLHLPALPAFENPPTDPDGDGLYEDLDGDGAFNIFDVQALFGHLDSAEVQDHAWAYNFNGDEGGEVSIFDVQALFTDL